MSAPILEAKGLEAWYGQARALHGVDFEVEDGGVTAVLGANGAGKTSLLRTITVLVRASSGTVTWKSEPRAVTVGAETMFKGLPQDTVTAPPLKLN